MRSFNDISGQQFSRLKALEPVHIPGQRGVFYRCQCDCGSVAVVYGGHLRAGSRKSCGCAPGANRKHLMSGSPEYKAWDNARHRCTNRKNRKYPLYGGRGIRMADEWVRSFETFFAELGLRPSDAHSLDRIDGNKGYEPGNCRWATAEEQNNNRSFNRLITIDGLRMTVAQAARATGVPHATILDRLNRGLSDDEAIHAS